AYGTSPMTESRPRADEEVTTNVVGTGEMAKTIVAGASATDTSATDTSATGASATRASARGTSATSAGATDADAAEASDARVGVRIARMFASPIGVLVTLPALIAAVGIGILLVGRDATRTASDDMARRLMTSHAASVQTDFAFALDQAGPVLERLRSLADRERSTAEVLVRIHDLVVGRPGVAYASISFPDGTFRGAYLEDGRVAVQESTLAQGGTDVQRFTVDGVALVPLRRETTDYDPRRRAFYQLAERTGARTWTEPYTFFASHETGITCTEPIYDSGNSGRTLRAVLTVDFDVGALSKYVARPA